MILLSDILRDIVLFFFGPGGGRIMSIFYF